MRSICLRVGLAPVVGVIFLLATPLFADSADLASRLESGSRSAADKARDAGRKPAAVVNFLEINPGMTVIDLLAAGGYYTDVLAEAVGPSGKVYA